MKKGKNVTFLLFSSLSRFNRDPSSNQAVFSVFLSDANAWPVGCRGRRNEKHLTTKAYLSLSLFLSLSLSLLYHCTPHTIPHLVVVFLEIGLIRLE